MARRAPQDEKPFRPLDVSLLHSVVKHVSVSEEKEPSHELRIADAVLPFRAERPDPPPLLVQRLDQEKRVLYTREERQALDRLVNNLAVRLQTQLKASHVLRALTGLLLNAESELDRRAGERVPMTRPANGDLAGLARFEGEIATLLSEAIRDAGPPRAS